MDKLRDFLKSWPGRILLVLCLAPMAFLVGGMGAGSRQNPNDVAVVGDASLTMTELQSAMTVRRQEIMAQGVDASLINNDVLSKQVLDELVNQNLLLQQTKQLGMGVSDQTITQLLQKDTQFLDENGNFSNELFANFLKSRGATKNQLFAQFRQQIPFTQINSSIVGTSIYSMPAINKLVDLQLESRDVWIHRIDWESYKDNVMVTDKDINEYYAKNKENLKSAEMVDLSYIELSPSLIKVDDVSEDEIKQQYEAYKQQLGLGDVREISQILLLGDDVDTKVSEIKTKIAEGADFAALAKEYSDDTSASNGGAIGRFNASVFGQEASKVKQALTGLSVGDVSEPVVTSYGTQIFKITAENTDGIPSLQSLKTELTNQAKAYKAQTIYADKVTVINDMAADGYGIQDIAKQEGLEVKKLTDYPKINNTTVLSQPAIIDSVFDEFTIQDQSVTTGVDVKETTFWMQPGNYRPVTDLSLEQATPVITDLLIKQKSVQLALADAQKLTDSIKTQSDIAKQNRRFESLGAISRQSKALTEAEKVAAFSPSITQGIVASASETKNGASVIVVKSSDNAKQINLDESQKQKTAVIVRENLGQNELQDYLEFLKLERGVELNQAAIDKSLS